MFQRLWQMLGTVWRAAKAERASPREIFWAVFLGVFAGCTPAVGFHAWLALGLATLFQKNRLMAFLGSRISFFLILPFVVLAEVQFAHRVRVGEWASIDVQHAAKRAPEYVLDWCLGTVPVGLALATLVGLLAYGLAIRRDRRVAKIMPERLPAGAPKPSSESPA